MQLLLDIMTVKLAGVLSDTVANGDGIRLALFFQGCPHHCDGCQNEHTWDYSKGYEAKLSDIFDTMEQLPKTYKGITLTGGEPFSQEEGAYLIARKAHELGFDVWTYTGYLYEDLRDAGYGKHALLNQTDVLVDGPFIQKMKKFDSYTGSSNQRIIHLKEARKTGGIMVHNEVIFVPREEN